MGSKGVALGQLLNRNTSVREVGNQVFDAGDSAPQFQYDITSSKRHHVNDHRARTADQPFQTHTLVGRRVQRTVALPAVQYYRSVSPFSIPVQAMLQTLCIRFVEDVLVAQRFSFAWRVANFPA